MLINEIRMEGVGAYLWPSRSIDGPREDEVRGAARDGPRSAIRARIGNDLKFM